MNTRSLLLILGLLALTSCSQRTTEQDAPIVEDFVGDPLANAHAATRYPPTACISNYVGAPLPVFHGRPLVGSDFHIVWHTVPSVPPAPPVPELMFLMVDTEQRPWAPLDDYGMPGCWLQVSPANMIFPIPGTGLTQDGGTLRLDISVFPHLVGTHLYVQCGILDVNANPGGAMVTPMIELTFGV